jgi:hypothetical protein
MGLEKCTQFFVNILYGKDLEIINGTVQSGTIHFNKYPQVQYWEQLNNTDG